MLDVEPTACPLTMLSKQVFMTRSVYLTVGGVFVCLFVVKPYLSLGYDWTIFGTTSRLPSEDEVSNNWKKKKITEWIRFSRLKHREHVCESVWNDGIVFIL